jgi:tRNA(fMet)-specific endonuclease VapC
MPMSGSYLLDTNIVIALFADEAVVKDNLAQASEIFIPSIVIGELYYGAKKSRQIEANLVRIDELVAISAILGCDTETARQYGDVKNNLRLKGRPLPENDVWIAALALQHRLTVVTRDAHFQEIKNLKTVAW